MNTFFLFDLPLSYCSLTKMVQQTKTLCLIYFSNNKFFFKCDAAGLQFNDDH